MLDKLEQDTSIEFAVITISSIDGLSIEDYSNQVYNELGIGKRDSDNGILLLIAADDSKVRLEIGRGLEGTLTDSICGRILDEHFVNHRSDGDYDAAVSETVSSIVSMELNNFNEADQTQDLTPLESLLLFFLAAVINIVILSWIFGCSPLDFLVVVLVTSMASMASVDLVDFLKAVLLVVVFQVEEVPQDRFPLSQKSYIIKI